MTKTDKQPTCEQRINAQWQSIRADLEQYMDAGEVYENGNDELPPFHEYGLSFDYVPAGTGDP